MSLVSNRRPQLSLFYSLTLCDTEFMQYIFQILAQLLESSPPETLSDNYKSLLGPLLNPSLWETRGNIPACTRLLSALIPRIGKVIVAENQLEPILGIFQRLLSGKKSDLYAFDLLDSIVKSIEPYVYKESSLQSSSTNPLQSRLGPILWNSSATHLYQAAKQCGGFSQAPLCQVLPPCWR